MSVAALKDATEDHVVQAYDSAVLLRINEPQAHIAIWQRPLPGKLTAWLNTLPAEQLPQDCFIAAPKDCEEILQEIWREYGHSGSIALQVAWDMARLCRLFAELMHAPEIHVRLEAVPGNACKKFHIDYVRARLISTYRGPGSEWGYAEPSGTPTVIHQMQTGDVALFKGSLFPGFESPQVLHRSPPIAGTGVTRLVLCLDVAEGSFVADHADG